MQNDMTEQVEEQALPVAMLRGEAVVEMPQDLYIPPDALEVFLETFSGPLDLLLYLIKRQNLEILDIPIAAITRQYMEYINLMKELRLELAAEYLVMAATLAEIKSRCLLPRITNENEEEEDPRAELIRRLQEYERFKQAAEDLDALPRVGREIFVSRANLPEFKEELPRPEIDFRELLASLQDVMRRVELSAHHHIQREPLSIRERMSLILKSLQADQFIEFSNCFTLEEGRMGVVVTFIAILELLKQKVIEVVQAELYAQIHIRAV